MSMSNNSKTMSSNMAFLRLAVGSASLALLSGCGDDCPAGEVQFSDSNQTCIANPCSKNETYNRADAKCIPKKAGGLKCNADNECASGDTCNKETKTCEASSNTPRVDPLKIQCLETQQYDEQQQKCVNKDADDKKCPDTPCLLGQVCNPTTGKCAVPNQCSADKHCPGENEKCFGGMCVPVHPTLKPGECRDDGDCATGNKCDISNECTESNPCPHVGKCVPKKDDHPKECPKNQHYDEQAKQCVHDTPSVANDCGATWSGIQAFAKADDLLAGAKILASYAACAKCMEDPETGTADPYNLYVKKIHSDIDSNIGAATKEFEQDPLHADFKKIAGHFITAFNKSFNEFDDDLNHDSEKEKKARDAVYAGSAKCGGPSADAFLAWAKEDSTKTFLTKHGVTEADYNILIENLD